MLLTFDSVVRTEHLGDDYPELLEYVKENGATVPSRIGETKELLNFRLELMNPLMCVTKRSGFSKKFMWEEIVQILAGVHDNERLRAITPLAADLITPATAYGPRIKDQLPVVADELKTDNTRRAVIYIGRPDDLTSIGEETAGEMPCTETLQFHLRQGFLHATVTMRSWDLVWGLGYDVPSFVAIQAALAKHVRARLGTYVHTAGSGHIYDRHYNIKVSEAGDDGRLTFSKGVLQDDIRETIALAQEHLWYDSYVAQGR